MKLKKIVMGAMLVILMAVSANGLTGCFFCRDCGPHSRHFR